MELFKFRQETKFTDAGKKEKTLMNTSYRYVDAKSKFSAAPLAALLLTLIASVALPANAAGGRFIAHNTPPYVSTAKNLGTEDPAKTIEVSLWLYPHHRAELDTLAQQLYDRTAPNYRRFLKPSQIVERFAPTAAEAKTVREFLESHNLSVVRVGPNNFFVRARGTVGDIETAFRVLLNNYQVRGKTIRANDRDPYVDGAAGPLVRSIAGLDSGEYEHPAMAQPAGLPNQKAAATGLMAASPDDLYSNNCFNGTEKESYSTNNDGAFPIVTFQGNHLNLYSLTSPGCGYTPPMIQPAYGLTGLYAKGFDGTGQTIGIIDWCGSLTILADSNAFSAQFGLPPLTPSNFTTTYIPTPSLCASYDEVEINIDVEWAHAVAPGAKINLIVPPSPFFQDIDEAEFTAVNYGLANVISGSYGSPESQTPPSVMDTVNLISEIAAVVGISTNFASGDAGDFTGYDLAPTVSTPADVPWATAVGGVTLALNSNNSIAWQSGWGNNETLLAQQGIVYDPPFFLGFAGGAGGGPSNCAFQDSKSNCLGGFPKPSYQHKLPGKYRQVPDISWLADPHTGVAILISIAGQNPPQVWQVWGGTSVACPMFSALWAIANQEAGAPLGQAAPYLYSLPAGAVTDIVPVSSKNNVTASIQESSTVTDKYTAKMLLGTSGPGTFVSAIWDYTIEQDAAVVVSFGTDCSTDPPGYIYVTPCTDPTSLHTTVGWDNVTGVGTPNAQAFADAFAPPASDSGIKK
jgi:subtilase family serine protease